MRHLIVIVILAASTLSAQTRDAERAAIARAGFDYIDGFYEGDTSKLARALRPELSKYGFWRDSSGKYSGEAMSYRDAIEYALKVRARGSRISPAWPRRVDLLDAGEQVAVLKITAWWGFDYALVAKYDGRWMIRDVMWEGPPRQQ